MIDSVDRLKFVFFRDGEEPIERLFLYDMITGIKPRFARLEISLPDQYMIPMWSVIRRIDFTVCLYLLNRPDGGAIARDNKLRRAS